MNTGCPSIKPFNAESVTELVRDTRFSALECLLETTSTNDLASARLDDPSRAGLTILAEHQTQGRGRHGRRWIAPPGSALLFTTLLPATVAAANLWAVPFWAGLAVRASTARACGVTLELQWPNDLLLRGRKACGILCTSRIVRDEASVGCGIGLNVHRPPEETALRDLSPEPAFVSDFAAVSREVLLVEILREFEATLELLAAPDEIARRWCEQAEIPGKRYRLRVDGEAQTVTGEAVGLGPSGALLIRSGKSTREIHLADARVVR